VHDDSSRLTGSPDPTRPPGEEVPHYASAYAGFGAHDRVRRETYGNDVGQSGWTIDELDRFAELARAWGHLHRLPRAGRARPRTRPSVSHRLRRTWTARTSPTAVRWDVPDSDPHHFDGDKGRDRLRELEGPSRTLRP
jgi:hypothetical protein